MPRATDGWNDAKERGGHAPRIVDAAMTPPSARVKSDEIERASGRRSRIVASSGNARTSAYVHASQSIAAMNAARARSSVRVVRVWRWIVHASNATSAHSIVIGAKPIDSTIGSWGLRT